MLMTDRLIQQAITNGKLEIINFAEKQLQPASYDVRLGEEAVSSTKRERVNPADKGLFIIPAGDFALVTTHERLRLSTEVAGHIGLRSHYTRKGLVLLSGPQVDPGFRGVLVLGLANLSPRDILIPHKEPFATLEFFQLHEPARTPYAGPYQDQDAILGRDIENLVEAPGMPFGEVIRVLGQLGNDVKALTDNVKALTESVNFLKWIFSVGVAFLALVVVIVSVLTRAG